MKVVLNGESRDLGAAPTVDQAVEATGAHSSRRGIAVAVEGEVVTRGEWATRVLREGEHVELLQAVQGG